ncbi:FYN-binding protein 1 isoform X1 [Tachysurus fulvidraco]|uniref:FYN-binding protein 1 isoform X1 n=2 Tax=Tachysurus fulvidraco TaxID=1234273 RepID=UPI000F4D8A60|nr:FYN-binding protein 1 isoform X1 [Tachysurus fulvidraco]
MDNKSDVKAIRARFQTAGVSTEGSATAAAAVARPKNALHPTLSGPMMPSKKPALEACLSGGSAATSINPKPNYMKNIVSNSNASESPKPKSIASRFENAIANEDSKPPFAKTLKPKPPDSNQNGESKLKVPLQKPPTMEAKNTFPKPPPVTAKPFKSTKIENNESTVNTTPTPPKIPTMTKPKSAINILRQQTDDGKVEDQTVKSFTRSNLNNSSFRAAQNMFSKAEETTKDESKSESSKESQVAAPIILQNKPAYKTKPSGPNTQTVKKDPSAPKRNPLTNLLALGSAPSKPNRPPKVNLEKFKKGTEPPGEGPEIKKGGSLPPPPPASHPSTHPAPTLPPRPPGPIVQQEEEYDDVGDLNDSSFGKAGRHDEGSGSDGEMYEELDGWAVPDVKEQEKKREKEEKKRTEQEKKDQKEREKKEQEARKKFKLSGPLKVIHKVKARVDCKGGRNDLSFKQGDSIDILRIADNPEGRWLGRTQDGSCGYVKTESVQIDFDVLKNQSKAPPEDDGDVYDDVASQEESSRSATGPGVILPPPPEGPDDIYDDLDDSSLNVRPDPRSLSKARSFIRMLKTPTDWRKSPVHTNEVPPPPQFSPENNPETEDVYDDVDTPQLPSSMPPSKLKLTKPEAKIDDPKKQKKFEKEEKDFRKKFKFEGEIQVLYQVTVIANKKGSGKDLAVQAGDTLDVISNVDNDKLICRNKDGKFGYVLNSNIQTEDNDIYDDVGDDCIYDNDN